MDILSSRRPEGKDFFRNRLLHVLSRESLMSYWWYACDKNGIPNKDGGKSW